MARKTWDCIKEIDNPNEAYSKFLYNFSSLYDEAFLKLEIKIKQKKLISPWITKGIMKSCKQKQKLYNKFLKLRAKENDKIYKAYKNLFEAIRKKSERTYKSELLVRYKNGIKNTWEIVNKIISNTINKEVLKNLTKL